MKTFADLCKESKYKLRDISNLYPDYAMPIGANDTVAIVAFFRNEEIRYTDAYNPCFDKID